MNGHSKLRDLDFLKKDINKLGDYQFFTVNEYINDIKRKLQNGLKVPKFYKNLYEEFLTNSLAISESQIVENNELAKNPVKIALSEIPLSEIQYYVDKREYQTSSGHLGRNGIASLGDLYSFDFRNMKLRKNLTGSIWQEFIRANYEEVISAWKDYTTIKEFPSEIDREEGLMANLRKGFMEISEVLASRKNSKRYDQTLRYSSLNGTNQLVLVADILHLRFGKDLNLNVISQKLGYTYENVRRAYSQTLTALLNGDIISENIRLNKSLIEWIQSCKEELQEEIIFKPINELGSVIGDLDEDMLYWLGLDFVDVAGDEGVKFIIPKDTKGVYRNISEALISVLKDFVIPKGRDEILEKTLSHKKIWDINFGWNELFIDNILSCNDLVSRTGNEEYFIKTKYLSTNEQKLARMIFEKGEPVANEQIKKEFEIQYGYRCSSGLQSLKKYGLILNQGNLWSFKGEELDPLKSFIENFAVNKGKFFYADLEKELIAAGYQIPDSIRTYITNLCLVDNKDKNHFCYKKNMDDYPDFSWRNQPRAGLTNWVLNRIRDFLIEKESENVTCNQMINLIENEARNTVYENYIRQRVQAILYSYSGHGKPFIIKDNIITKNTSIFDSVDFESIGLKGKKYAFYSQIRSIIQNALKKSEKGRILFTEAINLVNESLDESQSRKTIEHALTNRFMQSLDLELVNEDGSLFVIKTGETIKIEPTYEITVTSDDSNDIDEVVQIEPTAKREPISYRTVLNWKELESMLNHELVFYGRIMSFFGFELGENIQKFISFLKDSENRNLNNRLPQSLYEYWFASTDSYDRFTYVTNLTLYFEALLSEIYHKKHEQRLRTHGLGEWLRYFPYLQNALTTRREEATLYQKIFKQLYKTRNDIAHGEDIAMSSWEIAKAIADYTALYIFVIAKYA